MGGLRRAVGLGLAVGAVQSGHFVTMYLVDVGNAPAIALAVLLSTIVLWAAAGPGATVWRGLLLGVGSALVSALVLAVVVSASAEAEGASAHWNTPAYLLSHAAPFVVFGAVCGAAGALASIVVRRLVLSPGAGA